MEKEYLIQNLLIGNLHTTQLIGGIHGIVQNEVGPFFFCKQETKPGKKQQYKEIFEEEIKDIYKLSNSIESQKFNKTYIVEIDDIKNYLTEAEIKSGVVSNYRLAQIYSEYTQAKGKIKSNVIPMRDKKEEMAKQIVKMYVKEKKQVVSK